MFKVERNISLFSIDDESLVEEINVDILPLEALRNIFKPNADDPQMYLVYDIGEPEAEQLNRYLNVQFDFTKYTYHLYCYDVSTDD
ncbi:DUF7683 domain-containing protein [Paraflavitalea speifideaquila]|uniref:DUF7683 domain-containing protein n=1 Tax=Paraflavitalea speifideaquila TaxID=3076558 RepID=UPI003CCCEE58